MEDDKKEEIYEGLVLWFSRLGIGFLQWKKDNLEQKDMFVHFSDIDAEGFKMLHKGQKVSFEIGTNHKGQPKAISVKVLPEQK